MIKTGLIYVLIDKCIDVAFSVASENMKMPEKRDGLFTDRMRSFVVRINKMFGLQQGSAMRITIVKTRIDVQSKKLWE